MASTPALAQDESTPSPWPLHVYFLAVALLVIAVGAAAGGYLYARSTDDAKRAALADARFAAQKAATQLASGVRILDTAIKPALADPSLPRTFTHPADCNFGYAPVGAFETGVIDMVRRDGSVACGSGGPAAPGHPFSGQSWLRTRAVVAPVRDPTRHRQVAVLSYPVADQGVVAFLLDLAPIGPKLASEFGSGVHKLEFVVVSGNAVATRSTDPGRWIGRRVDTTRLAPSGRDLDGKARWYGSAAVEQTPWRVYVGADRAAALGAAAGLRNAELEILGGGVAAVLLALAFVYRRVARPIRSLSRSVRFSDGEAVPIQGPAEVSRLAEDVNGFMATIRQTEESYRHLFDGSPLPMFIYAPATFRVLEANDAVLALYGYSRAEFLALGVKDILAPEDQPLLEDRAASGEPAIRLGEVTHIRKGGGQFPARVTAHATTFNGIPARFVMVEDVSERQRLEARVRQAERMEVVGELAAGIAHDFNNILTVISGANALVQKDLRREDALSRERLRQIELASRHAADLTQQLLAFGRQQVLKPEPTDLNGVLEETLTLADRLLGDDIELVRKLEPTAPIVIDRSQLQQVILNLCVNARDAMPGGGKLTVRTAGTELDAAYAAERVEVTAGPYVLLEISDTGVGMDRATAKRMFEPFFTTKQAGTGLGLATVHGIIKQSGGHVSVYSEPGLGTTFSVYLPQAGAAARPPVEEPDAGQLEGDETILVVEDAELLRALVVHTVESYGYTVLAAGSGIEALELAERNAGGIDLLFTDVVMPQMSGRELAETLMASHPELKVLFTSGYPADMVFTEGVADERFAHIQKPYLGDDLAQMIRETLEAPRRAVPV